LLLDRSPGPARARRAYDAAALEAWGLAAQVNLTLPGVLAAQPAGQGQAGDVAMPLAGPMAGARGSAVALGSVRPAQGLLSNELSLLSLCLLLACDRQVHVSGEHSLLWGVLAGRRCM